jgi:hypothetical protein
MKGSAARPQTNGPSRPFHGLVLSTMLAIQDPQETESAGTILFRSDDLLR